MFAVGVSVWERYTGPYTDEAAARDRADAATSGSPCGSCPSASGAWDHRKLGLPAMPVGGTTAAYLSSSGTTAAPDGCPTKRRAVLGAPALHSQSESAAKGAHHDRLPGRRNTIKQKFREALERKNNDQRDGHGHRSQASTHDSKAHDGPARRLPTTTANSGARRRSSTHRPGTRKDPPSIAGGSSAL